MSSRIDPVCGMEVPDSTSYTTLHGGRKLFFCSSECRKSFLHEPETYMQLKTKKEEEEKKKAA